MAIEIRWATKMYVMYSGLRINQRFLFGGIILFSEKAELDYCD